MQDIRNLIDIIENNVKPQVGDAFDLEFGKDKAVISTVIEQVVDDAIILQADSKAIDFISKLPVHEDYCGCAMCQGPEEPEHEEKVEQDHEVGMGKSQMYHAMKNAKAIHDMLQQVSEREGIEGWVASKLTKASDYLKVVKDYLEYEMVQAGFDKNEQDVNEAVDKSALKAWYNKYSKYEGNNGDKLPNGMFLGYTDTGILTDGVEINEFTNLVNKHFGGDREEAEDKVFSDEIMYKFLPITHAMREEFFKIMGDLDEDTCRKAVQILGEDIVGFSIAEDDGMSTGTVAVGKKGKTRRATGIDDNPYDHNEGEDQTALANAALWNMKDVYQTLIAGESLSEDDMFSYGDLVQYLEQADMPDHYSKFWDLITDAINSAGGFAGQGDAIDVDKNIAPQIKTLYQQFKSATAKIKGVKENERELPSPTFKIPASMSIPMALHHLDQMEVTKQLRQAAGFPESAYVYFDDADLVYGDKTVWPQCGVDRKCKFGDAVEALKKFATAGVKEDEGSDKEKWLRYSKFWKYIRDIMAQEADADIADGFISADNIDEEPSYVTAKEMMQTAMAKQNTPWNDSIIDSDLREYKHQISDNDNYTEDTNFGKMKKAAIEMITTGKTQIVPYRGYPPMDQMDYSAEDTTDEDINDIIRLSGIK